MAKRYIPDKDKGLKRPQANRGKDEAERNARIHDAWANYHLQIAQSHKNR